MNLFGVMDISASALKAQRVRAEVVAANMANSETTRAADGGPYRRHHVVFAANEGMDGGFGASFQGYLGAGHLGAGQVGLGHGSNNLVRTGPIAMGGVHQWGGGGNGGGVTVAGVIEDQSAPLTRFEPSHPDAGADGYVAYPDINPLTEMVDLMGATRSYGMNASAVQAEKGMLSNSLDLLK